MAQELQHSFTEVAVALVEVEQQRTITGANNGHTDIVPSDGLLRDDSLEETAEGSFKSSMTKTPRRDDENQFRWFEFASWKVKN